MDHHEVQQIRASKILNRESHVIFVKIPLHVVSKSQCEGYLGEKNVDCLGHKFSLSQRFNCRMR